MEVFCFFSTRATIGLTSSVAGQDFSRHSSSSNFSVFLQSQFPSPLPTKVHFPFGSKSYITSLVWGPLLSLLLSGFRKSLRFLLLTFLPLSLPNTYPRTHDRWIQFFHFSPTATHFLPKSLNSFLVCRGVRDLLTSHLTVFYDLPAASQASLLFGSAYPHFLPFFLRPPLTLLYVDPLLLQEVPETIL